MVDQLTLTLVAAILNGVSLAVGMIIGTRMTGDVFEKKFKNIVDKSPTAKRIMKLLEKVDVLFGDEQAVEQFTRFFREAADLVGSEEAKSFFKNVTELMKDLSEPQKVGFKMPKREGKKGDGR